VSDAPLDVERLYRSHGNLVLRRARALLGSEPDAHEALQEVFAALLREPERLRRVRSIVGWLYRATTHYCLKQLRDRRTGARLLEQHAGDAAASLSEAQGETLVQVRGMLAMLPDEAATAVVYRYLDGMSHAEVAEMLGCSRRKVGYLLERAHGLLRREEWTA
jgi:RNA polymerase sigma-70 factor (ECF subfamily)